MHAKILTPMLCLATAAAMGSLTGCGVNGSAPPTNYKTAATLQGQVFAGRNYMASATVKIYVTQPSGSATNGTYVGTAKLLKTITANTTGGWSVAVSDIGCSSPDMVYVTAEGGIPYPGALNSTPLSNNPNSLMMTAIGDCSLLTTGAVNSNNITSIVTNEASTVAAVYALRNFISLNGTTVNVTSSATNYAGTSGVGVPGNYAGLAHAFLNANNLAPYKLGAFQQWTAGGTDATNGGVVQVQELNSLAYAQYLCTIGGDGTKAGDFSYCTTLYSLTTPPGGTAPTNSLQAMLNIATYPTNNAAGILAFTQTPIPGTAQTGPQQINAGVYVPALSATGLGTLTNDWSVAIYYGPGYGAGSAGQATLVPSFVTIDANDTAFFSNPTASSSSTGANVVAVKSDGTPLWTSANDTTKAKQPRAIAADSVGHVWTVDAGTPGYITEFDAATGAQVAQFTSTAGSLYGVAVDSLNNVWYTSNLTTTQNLHELVKNGSTYAEATFSPIPLSATYGLVQLRPDKNNNIWIAGYSTAKPAAVYFPNTGTATAPTYTAGLLYAPLNGASSTYGITTDAAGTGYAVTNGTGSGIWKITATGTGASTVLTPTNAAANPAAASRFMDIDGVGNIYYVDNTTGTSLYRYVPSTNAVTSYYPCYNASTIGGGAAATCGTGISTRFDFAIDSTGSIWVASYGNSGGGRLVQILGLAAPTVPLKSLGKMGVMP